MSRTILDLTPDELDAIAREAWSDAGEEALARGMSITGLSNGRRVVIHPDGRVETDPDASPEGTTRPPQKTRLA